MGIKAFFKSILVLVLTSVIVSFYSSKKEFEDKIVSYTVDSKKESVKLYLKNEKGNFFGSIKDLKQFIENKNQSLLFAMNGGMYKNDYSPQGLYIENSKVINQIDTLTGNGNFYLKPNGVFYITSKNEAYVSTSERFKENTTIKYATQSGPMLVINGQIHPKFNQTSKNLNIRNGVGILPNGNILFAISKEEINFYDFANFFKKNGCLQALYLDGFVSRAYIPTKKWEQTDGNFGVIIAVTK